MLQSYVVHRGNRQFLMTCGQPQGACLSSVLCDLYYSDVDKTQLREFQNDNDLLIRAVDDYLYVTTNLNRAAWYVTN
jgi:telomerase reverse transcriptase